MEPWQMNLSRQKERALSSLVPTGDDIHRGDGCGSSFSATHKKTPHWHTWIFRASPTPPSWINPISLKCLEFQSFSSSGDGRWSAWKVSQQGQRPHSLRPSSLVFFFLFLIVETCFMCRKERVKRAGKNLSVDIEALQQGPSVLLISPKPLTPLAPRSRVTRG